MIEPGARVGDPAMIRTEPTAGLATFTETITTGPPDTPSDFAVVRQPGTGFILLRGTIALGRTPTRVDIAMTEPAADGGARAQATARSARRAHHGHDPRAARAAALFQRRGRADHSRCHACAAGAQRGDVLAEHISEPLLESIRVTNKMSQNLHAELLLRAVGARKLGVGSTAAGLKMERDFLKAAGVADGDILLSDGSGLGARRSGDARARS